MTTSAQATARISAITSRSESFVRQVVRSLRDAGTIPKSYPGGNGKAAPHLSASSIADIFLAVIATMSPIDAPETVRRLRRLKPVDKTIKDGPIVYSGEPSFGEAIEQIIIQAKTSDGLSDLAISNFTLSVEIADPFLASASKTSAVHPRLDIKSFYEPDAEGEPILAKVAYPNIRLSGWADWRAFGVLAEMLLDTETKLRRKS